MTCGFTRFFQRFFFRWWEICGKITNWRTHLVFPTLLFRWLLNILGFLYLDKSNIYANSMRLFRLSRTQTAISGHATFPVGSFWISLFGQEIGKIYKTYFIRLFRLSRTQSAISRHATLPVGALGFIFLEKMDGKLYNISCSKITMTLRSSDCICFL